MPNAYDNADSATDFNRFLESDDGRIQKQLLYRHIIPHLPDKHIRILDAACGEGWLSRELKQNGYKHVEGFDSSEPLIRVAQTTQPDIIFNIADAGGDLPYEPQSFDAVILNMAAHDLQNLSHSFANLHRTLKPGGTFIMTVANPYYSFPVGLWKRGIIGRLLRRKPQLKMRPYNIFKRQTGTLFNWRGALSSYFYPLSEYINQALNCGFSLKAMHDLASEQDSPQFNVQYQLYRFPVIVLLAFEKRGE